MARSRRGVEVGAELERVVEYMLDLLKNQGHVVEEYHLLRARHYPDFWVKDAKGREYLLECKATTPGDVDKSRHFVDPAVGKKWVEELPWVERNILSKAWKEPQYETRIPKGQRHGLTVRVNNPVPVLVSKNWLWDLESLRAFHQMFGNRVIFYGSRNLKAENLLYVFERLREMFTREGYGE